MTPTRSDVHAMHIRKLNGKAVDFSKATELEGSFTPENPDLPNEDPDTESPQ